MQACVSAHHDQYCIHEPEICACINNQYAYVQAIERKQLVLYEQVGGVVGLLLEREAETARLRAELATSRFVCARTHGAHFLCA